MCVSLYTEPPPPVPLTPFLSPAVTCTSPSLKSPIPHKFAISASEPRFLFDPSFSSDDNSTLFGTSDFILKLYSYADTAHNLSLPDHAQFVTTDERGHHRRPANSGAWPEGSGGSFGRGEQRGHLHFNRYAVPRSTIGFDPLPYVAQQGGLPPQPFPPTLGHDVSDDQEVHADSTFSYHSPHTEQPSFTNNSTYFASNPSSLYTPQYTTLNDPHSQASPSYNTAYQPPSLTWDISPSSHGAPSPSLPLPASYPTPTIRTSGETFTPDYEYQRMYPTPSAHPHFLPPHGTSSIPTSSLGLAFSPHPFSQPLSNPASTSPRADDPRPPKRMRTLPEHEREVDDLPSSSDPIPIHRSLRLTIPPAPQSAMVTDDPETDRMPRKSKARERKPRSRTASGRVPPRRPRTSRHETLPSILPESAILRSSSPQSPAAFRTPNAAADPHFSSHRPSEASLAHSAPAALRHFPTTIKSPLSEGRLSVGATSSPYRQDEEMREQVVDFRPDPVFEHGPTEFPPRPYPGGPNAQSRWAQPKPRGKIPGSAMDYLPILEARFDRLERSITGYVERRGQAALANSVLPGLSPIPTPVPSSGSRPRQQYPQL